MSHFEGCSQLGLVGRGATVIDDSGNPDETELQAKQRVALERYQNVVGSEGERLVSGSDDFTLFMWKPQESKTPMTRMVVSSRNTYPIHIIMVICYFYWYDKSINALMCIHLGTPTTRKSYSFLSRWTLSCIRFV